MVLDSGWISAIPKLETSSFVLCNGSMLEAKHNLVDKAD